MRETKKAGIKDLLSKSTKFHCFQHSPVSCQMPLEAGPGFQGILTKARETPGGGGGEPDGAPGRLGPSPAFGCGLLCSLSGLFTFLVLRFCASQVGGGL